VTYFCVAIFADSTEQVRRDSSLAAEAGADMIELRIDRVPQLEPIAWTESVIRASALPCIVTCRAAYEGGECSLAEPERLSLLNKIAESSSANLIDVELAAEPRLAAFDLPREKRAGIIVSAHDFASRPDRLYNILTEMNATPADVNKIVWHARTIRDNLEAFSILQQRSRPTIALCMGEAGLISRILAKKFGAFLTFAAIESGGGTAPGQISVSDMKRLYRWDAIGSDTKVYGVVADPVKHSMSPAIHNAGFSAVGHDGVYLPLLVNPGYESFKAFMETFLNFEGLHLSGLSITIPHKENALRYLKEKAAEVEPLAERIGAVNTIVIKAGLPLRGFNTDYAAILDTITTKLSISREQLKDYRVAVIGAGGTGRTAVAALAEYGATVVVYNRTKERADELAAEFNGKTGQVVSARLEKLCDSCCHIFINTTSAGMHPSIDVSPLDNNAPKFSPDTLVFDTIYNPMRTKLLRQAQESGAKTVAGVEMFIRQAARQFEWWTNHPAPLALFRQVVEQRLSP